MRDVRESCRSSLYLLGVLLGWAALPGLGIATVDWGWHMVVYRIGIHVDQNMFAYEQGVNVTIGINTEDSMERRASEILSYLSYYVLFCVFFCLASGNFIKSVDYLNLWLTVGSLVSFLALVVVGYIVLGISVARSFTVLAGCITAFVALRFTLPKMSRIPSRVLFQSIGVLIGTAYFICDTMGLVPRNSEVKELIRLCILMPLVREVSRFACVKSTYALLCQEMVQIEPSNIWPFIIWQQVTFGVFFRLEVVNLTNPFLMIFVVIVQGVQELLFRLSHEYRDAFYSKCFSMLPVKGSRRKSAAVIDLSLFTSSERELQIYQKSGEAKRVFYTLVCLSDMISEYASIFYAAWTIFLWRKHMLVRQYPIFAPSGVVVEEPQVWTLAQWTFLQVIAEVTVDFVCLIYEERYRGFDARTTWNAKGSTTLMKHYVFAGFYGCMLANALVFNQQDLTQCIGNDVCFCEQKKTVLQAYCTTRFPETGGFPAF